MAGGVAIGLEMLTATPREDALEELSREWSWLLPSGYEPVLFSALGDMFYETPKGEVWWLNTGTAELLQVAESRDEFVQLLATDVSADWFLPPLIEKLRAAGKILLEGQCYSFIRLPIFKDGTYTVDNMYRIDAREHFGVTGSIHKKIQNLPDGAQVEIRVLNR